MKANELPDQTISIVRNRHKIAHIEARIGVPLRKYYSLVVAHNDQGDLTFVGGSQSGFIYERDYLDVLIDKRKRSAVLRGVDYDPFRGLVWFWRADGGRSEYTISYDRWYTVQKRLWDLGYTAVVFNRPLDFAIWAFTGTWEREDLNEDDNWYFVP